MAMLESDHRWSAFQVHVGPAVHGWSTDRAFQAFVGLRRFRGGHRRRQNRPADQENRRRSPHSFLLTEIANVSRGRRDVNETETSDDREIGVRPAARSRDSWETLWTKRYLGESCSTGGNDSGVVKDRSGGFTPVCRAWCTIASARPAVGGMTTVAASVPVRTQVCPVFGTPSQPTKGRR